MSETDRLTPSPASESGPGAGTRPRSRIAALATVPFLAAIHAYRILLGPWLGGHCRFQPTCSQYALDAYRAHNPVRASWLTLRRLCRCHPLGGHGFDPVPETANRGQRQE